MLGYVRMGYTGQKKRDYQRKWIAARRATWLEGKVCKECGRSDSLNVDHVDPTTKVDHRVWSWSLVRMTDELAKCQVLCAKCHCRKTAEVDELRPITQHGAAGMYESHKCRCELCREWKRRVNAQRKTRGWVK